MRGPAAVITTAAPASNPTPTPTPTLAPTTTPPPKPTELPPTEPPPTSTEPPGGGQIELFKFTYREDFTTTPGHWEIGERSDEIAEVSFELEDGQYVWVAEAFVDMAWLQLANPDVPLPEGDFQYSASLGMESETDELAAGILFNCQDIENLYFAKLTSSGEASAYILIDNEWQLLVEEYPSDHFLYDGDNKLIVTKRGDDYEIQVNDYPVATFRDDRLTGGTIGLAVELETGERVRFSFDELQMLQAGGSAAQLDEPPPTIVPMGASWDTFESQARDVVYFLDYPRSFLHSTSGGWQQFCLDAPEDLCVSIQAHEDYAGDEAALADEVITGFSAAVSDYQELHRQSARTASGLPAVFVSYTYTRGEQEIEGARLFVTAQGVGFDIAVEGEPVMVEVYRSIMKGVQESLRILE